MNMQNMGKYIVKLRKGKGWTQQQLAEQLRVSPQAVSKWECGESVPYIDMSKEDSLIQQIGKYHAIANFPMIRLKDNVALRDMQYRIILGDVVMADNDLEYVEEEKRIEEMLSYIKLYINK